MEVQMGRKKVLKGIVANAPLGATHYSESFDMYYTLEDGAWTKHVNNNWWLCRTPMCDLVELSEIKLNK